MKIKELRIQVRAGFDYEKYPVCFLCNQFIFENRCGCNAPRFR